MNLQRVQKKGSPHPVMHSKRYESEPASYNLHRMLAEVPVVADHSFGAHGAGFGINTTTRTTLALENTASEHYLGGHDFPCSGMLLNSPSP